MRHIPALPSDSPLLASAYAACDVFVLPAYYETPGLAALEAGLAGAKICITRHGGTMEYFGDLADYLEPSDQASIRNALMAALARPKTPQLRETILSKYLWSHAGKRLAAAYGQLMG
jgi:glycosyltransferase involved in cell wall biosynthesis